VGWTPLFSGIGGIVAETGGQLSHTSIIAREYGLPAVVSVRQATHLISDGQPITVDGAKGRVYLKHLTDS
jgi:pyruvate,water dikinase